MRIFSIFVLILLCLVVVYLGVYLVVVRIFLKKTLGRKNTAKRINENSSLIDIYQIDICWWNKVKLEDLTLISHDGLKLKGHFYDNKSDRLAIIVHGYGSDYREMGSYAKLFANMGYNILALENRAHGKSEGKLIGMGWIDRLDILDWINLMVEKNPKCKILLFGLSMGGSAVCMTLGEVLPKNVVCAISDSAFSNVYDQINFVFNPKNIKIKTIFMNMFNNYMCRAYMFDFKKADAKQALKKSSLPVMLIHGNDDKYVPVDNIYSLSESISDFRKDIYVVSEADHAMCYAVSPRKYENKIREFLKKYNM